MNIVVVGLGLIGGSIASELMQQIHVRVIGVESNIRHAETALQKKLVHEILSLHNALPKADLVVLAIPVDAIALLLPEILSEMPANCIVMDTGSTKAVICNQVEHHPRRGRFVAAHPLAGTEHSGPEAAVRGLFNGKKTILCEIEKSDQDALSLVMKINQVLGLHSMLLNAEEHDRHLAYVSHLSHVTSFALGKTVLDIEKDDDRIFDLAGSGFSSTVRLAKSSPVTWSSIFYDNRRYVLEALDAYVDQLHQFRKCLLEENKENTTAYLIKSQEIKRIL
jgi:prephenate dehydrogenase